MHMYISALVVTVSRSKLNRFGNDIDALTLMFMLQPHRTLRACDVQPTIRSL